MQLSMVRYKFSYAVSSRSAQTEATGKTLAPDESPTIVDTWIEMEKLLETGNFIHLHNLLKDI